MTPSKSSKLDDYSNSAPPSTESTQEPSAELPAEHDTPPPPLDEPTLLPTWEDSPTLLPGSEPNRFDEDRTRIFLEAWNNTKGVEGQTLGNYHRLHRIGGWRFGSLYEAEHCQLHRRVRLLTMESPWCENPGLKAWFLSQARAIAGIPAASVASSLLECDEIGDVVFLCAPAQNQGAIHPLRQRATRLMFSVGFEPLSHALHMLFLGLNSFHERGLVHGAIDSCHIAVDNTAEEVQFDPLATGMPEAELIGADGAPCEDRTTVQNEDCRQLARAFVAMLLGATSKQIPSNWTWRWLLKRLPFLPAELAKILSELSRTGFADKRGLLEHLAEMRYAVVTHLTWSDRLLHMVRQAMLMVLFTLVILPIAILSLSSFFFPFMASESSDQAFESALLVSWISAFLAITASGIFVPRLSIRSEFSRVLIDWDGGVPSLRQKFLRFVGQAGSVLGLATLLTVPLALSMSWLSPQLRENGVELDLGWVSIFLGMLFPALLLVSCTPLIFQGHMFHDWLSRTKWVRRRTSKNEPIIQAQHLKPSRGFLGNPLVHIPSSDFTVERIDGISVEKELGVGGMGTVYLATDESLHRPVAVKVISAFSSDTEEIVQRFRREAQLGSIMNHPNIAKVYRVGLWENRPFMEMEFVDGETLQQIVSREGPVDVKRAWSWIRQAATGLQEADQHGIIHRDIKPTNLMVRHDGLVKLMDFGISKSLKDDEPEPQTMPQRADGDAFNDAGAEGNLTRAGAILGTPQYMSPEQVRCEPVDRRSDIYSLGLTLYYLLSGRTAFEGSGIYDVMMRQCTEPPPPLPPRILNEAQQVVLGKMVAKSNSDRFQDYESLIAALDASQPEELRLPSTSRRFTAMFADFGLTILIMILAELLMGTWSETTANVAKPIVVAVFLIGYMVRFQGTPGHQLLGLQVMRLDGGRVGWKESTLRYIGKYPIITLSFLLYFLPVSQLPESNDDWIGMWTSWGSMVMWIASYVVVNVNYSTHRRAIHDYVAGTQIVYAKRGWFMHRLLYAKRS